MGLRRYQIEDRVVLITGGARGIGADAAARLAARGAHVVLVDRDSVALERHAAELGGRALPFVADVTDAAALDQIVASTIERLGGIDVVVANAGISGPTATAAAMDPAEFEQVIEVNLLGVWRTVRAALPHVVDRRGYVLAIASMAAVTPSPLLVPYSTAKAGVEAFARSLRIELAHTGTKAGVGYFGFIDTDMVRNALADPVAARSRKGIPAPFRRIVPVGAAGEAIVRGIERRAKRVYAPRWVGAALVLRGLSGPLDDLAGRHPRFVRALRELETRGATPSGRAEEAERLPTGVAK